MITWQAAERKDVCRAGGTVICVGRLLCGSVVVGCANVPPEKSRSILIAIRGIVGYMRTSTKVPLDCEKSFLLM